MLNALGYSDLKEFVADVVPADILDPEPPIEALPEGCGEAEALPQGEAEEPDAMEAEERELLTGFIGRLQSTLKEATRLGLRRELLDKATALLQQCQARAPKAFVVPKLSGRQSSMDVLTRGRVSSRAMGPGDMRQAFWFVRAEALRACSGGRGGRSRERSARRPVRVLLSSVAVLRIPIDAPCTQCLRPGDPMHASK